MKKSCQVLIWFYTPKNGSFRCKRARPCACVDRAEYVSDVRVEGDRDGMGRSGVEMSGDRDKFSRSFVAISGKSQTTAGYHYILQ